MDTLQFIGGDSRSIRAFRRFRTNADEAIPGPRFRSFRCTTRCSVYVFLRTQTPWYSNTCSWKCKVRRRLRWSCGPRS